MNLTPKISILLSTYNGAKYLAEQLDSLLEQSYTNIVIVIRDDGSTDATRELISLYALNMEIRSIRFAVTMKIEAPETAFLILSSTYWRIKYH